MQLNSRQRKILNAIFTDPVPASLAWADLESLLKAVGCTMKEGKGSAVQFERDKAKAYFHRPHPRKEAKPYQIRDARGLLETLGVTPWKTP